MAHIIFASYGHKSAHDSIIKDMNNWRYKLEGDKRIGYAAPVVSEIRFYDVRLPEKNVPEFLRDLQPMFMNPKAKHKTPIINLAQKVLFRVRKFLGFKNIEKATDAQVYKLRTSWCYNFLIGVLEDDVVIDSLTKEKKEML